MRSKPHRLLQVIARYSNIRFKLLAKIVLNSVLASSAKRLSINQGRLDDLMWSFGVGITQSLS